MALSLSLRKLLLKKPAIQNKTAKMKSIEHHTGHTIEELLQRLYADERRSTVETGHILGIGSSAVTVWLRQAGIPRRPLREAVQVKWSKNRPADRQLRRWCLKEKRSARAIAQQIGVDGNTVRNWLRQAVPEEACQKSAFYTGARIFRNPPPGSSASGM